MRVPRSRRCRNPFGGYHEKEDEDLGGHHRDGFGYLSSREQNACDRRLCDDHHRRDELLAKAHLNANHPRSMTVRKKALPAKIAAFSVFFIASLIYPVAAWIQPATIDTPIPVMTVQVKLLSTATYEPLPQALGLYARLKTRYRRRLLRACGVARDRTVRSTMRSREFACSASRRRTPVAVGERGTVSSGGDGLVELIEAVGPTQAGTSTQRRDRRSPQTPATTNPQNQHPTKPENHYPQIRVRGSEDVDDKGSRDT